MMKIVLEKNINWQLVFDNSLDWGKLIFRKK